MQKLTSILAVLEKPWHSGAVLRKAVAVAQALDARLELLVIEPLLMGKVVPQCAVLGYPKITVRGAPRLRRRVDSVVLTHVEQTRPDLVIKARSGNHPLRRCSLTPNDWSLSRESPVPLMLAGPRSWASPVRLAAAVDVSDSEALGVARAVMQAAGFFALGLHGNLDVLYTERERNDDMLRMERAVRLAALVREFHVGCERLQMFDGLPENRLPPLVSARQYDLMLLGAVTHRTGVAEALCPLTSRLVDATPGDVVLVRPPDVKPQQPRVPDSAIEQRPHHRYQLV
jgi:nucleotide-binding universal stress UspA family protein